MAAIRERIDENGQKSYQAQVRIQGYPPHSKTFLRKTDAKKWAVQTETEIRTGMHIRQSQAGKHTAKEMLEKYKDEKLGVADGANMYESGRFENVVSGARRHVCG